VTRGSGIDFTYRNGDEAGQSPILETLGGGGALFDYDGDGRLDIFVTGGGYFTGPDGKVIKGHPCKLYRNLGNWKFQDVTRDAGLGDILFDSHGAAVTDYDRDGWPDLLVTGYDGHALFHNEGDGTTLRPRAVLNTPAPARCRGSPSPAACNLLLYPAGNNSSPNTATRRARVAAFGRIRSASYLPSKARWTPECRASSARFIPAARRQARSRRPNGAPCRRTHSGHRPSPRSRTGAPAGTATPPHPRQTTPGSGGRVGRFQ
jgi:hypothetical protein